MNAKTRGGTDFPGYADSGSIEISAPGAFTAIEISGAKKKNRASAAERGRLTLLKTIDEDRRARHDYINRSGQIHLSRREICPNNRDHRCKTIYRLTVKGDVPVDGFWSISVYGADGYFVKNEQSAYSVNNVTAKKEVDGSIGIQFGGCDGKMPNCIPTTSGWNYWVRLYRPCAEILNGQWKFPDPERVQ